MKGTKTGGRVQGTPNKKTTELKTWVKNLLERNQKVFERDLSKVKPSERLAILQSLLKYSIPALASNTIEATIQAEYNELKALLDSASPEAIEKISEKIIYLNNQTNE